MLHSLPLLCQLNLECIDSFNYSVMMLCFQFPTKHFHYDLIAHRLCIQIVKLLALALTNLVLSLVNLAKPSLGQPSY